MAHRRVAECIEGVAMNQGTLAILVILATIGVAIFAATHRDLLFPASNQRSRVPGKHLHSRQPALRVVRGSSSARPETTPKQHETVSTGVSGVATSQEDPETIALRTIAKLVAEDLLTETKALETVFNVKAGSSKEYKRVHAKLKSIQAQLERLVSDQEA